METQIVTHPGAGLPTGQGRVQRRRLVTRERLITVALDLFATRGYHQTSMDAIAEQADVARTTVFNHFARKDTLLLAALARRRAVVDERLRETRDGPLGTGERVRDAVRQWALIYESDPAKGIALIRAWVQAGGPHLADANNTAALFADAVRDGLAAGDIRFGVDPDLAGQVLFDTAGGALMRWAAPRIDEPDGRADRDRRTDLTGAMLLAVDLAMSGMLLPAG